MPRYPAFFIGIAISGILGATLGSILCYVFSGLNVVWLMISLIFGLVLLGSLIWAYHYFRGAGQGGRDSTWSNSPARVADV